MRIERYDDPGAFFARAGGFLEAREPENNLILGFRDRLEADPHAFGAADPRLFVGVDDEGRIVGAATQTPPFGLVLAEGDDDAFVDELAALLAAEHVELPTVIGSVARARLFADRWTDLAEVDASVQMNERIYAATDVTLPTGVPGRMRKVAETDRALVVEWIQAFFDEAVQGMPNNAAGFADRVIAARSLRLWEDGASVVSFAGHSGDTPNGARVGPVYTPPKLRGRGYASAVTAALTAELLGTRRFCFLYTDLANPTSNSIYQRMGYRPVTDVTLWAFAPR